jgi:hypothetical protein
LGGGDQEDHGLRPAWQKETALLDKQARHGGIHLSIIPADAGSIGRRIMIPGEPWAKKAKRLYLKK